MIKNFTLFSLLISLLAASSCYPEKGKRIRQIAVLEDKLLHKAQQHEVDQHGVNRLLEDYAVFAADFPEDSLAPEYLYKRAQFLQHMRFWDECIDGYQLINISYPDYRHSPFCLFVQGFLYDSELQNYEKAGIKYEEFLKKYPKHPLAKDVDLLLLQLGKSPQELVEAFQNRTENQSADSLVQ